LERKKIDCKKCNKSSTDVLKWLPKISLCEKCYKKQWKLNNAHKEKENNKSYYDNNKIKIKQYQEEYRKENPDKIKESSVIYRKNNKDKIAKKQQEWNNSNKNNISKYQKEYRKNNQGKRNAIRAKYRAAKIQRTPHWLTKEDLKQIELIYIKARQLTVDTGVKHHVDHIIPLQGENVSGLHVIQNLQIITASENCSKGNKYG